MELVWKRNLADAAKFIAFFLLTFLVGQLVKNPLESALINSSIASELSYKITFIFIAIPNIIFYFLAGFALYLLMKERFIFWSILFCVLELVWILMSTSAVFFEQNIYSYLLIYFRYIIIPFTFFSGILTHKRLIKARRSA